jgi:hypothetical protein
MLSLLLIIRSILRFNHDHLRIGISVDLLADILSLQGKLGDETKELYERSLAIQTNQEGPDGINTAFANNDIGKFYHDLAETQQSSEKRVEHLHASLSKYQEALRINTKILGSDNPLTIQASLIVSLISRKLSEG